jgi:hypothetical protein
MVAMNQWKNMHYSAVSEACRIGRKVQREFFIAGLSGNFCEYFHRFKVYDVSAVNFS